MRLRNMLKICLVFLKSEPQYAHKHSAYRKNQSNANACKRDAFDNQGFKNYAWVNVCSMLSIIISSEKNECLESNGNCTHVCVDEVGGYRCYCLPGYRLNSNGRTCEGERKFIGRNICTLACRIVWGIRTTGGVGCITC